LAILSQPPGSVQGAMRVTIQGETIDTHFGLPGTASQTLVFFLSFLKKKKKIFQTKINK